MQNGRKYLHILLTIEKQKALNILKTAVVILNWNGREHLEKYLPYLLENTNNENVELVLADNGSTDDSLSFVRANYEAIKIVELDKNYGFAGGYNRALAHVEADVYCLLNSDVRVSKGWLNNAIQVFRHDDDIVAVQPKILSDRDPSRFEHAGAAGGFIDKYAYPFCRGRIMNVIEPDSGQYNSPGEIFWASGACLFIKANAFWLCNGFDDDYFAHMEEIDLCWRLKNRGFKIMYAPLSTVYHYGGATLEYNNPRKLFLNFRNSLFTLYKNYTGRHLSLVMFVRMLIDTTAIAKFLATFEWKNAKAVINAHRTYYKNKTVLKQKRAQIQQNVSTRKHRQIFNGSIVLNFFLFSKKKFSQLNKFGAAQ